MYPQQLTRIKYSIIQSTILIINHRLINRFPVSNTHPPSNNSHSNSKPNSFYNNHSTKLPPPSLLISSTPRMLSHRNPPTIPKITLPIPTTTQSPTQLNNSNNNNNPTPITSIPATPRNSNPATQPLLTIRELGLIRMPVGPAIIPQPAVEIIAMVTPPKIIII